MRTVRSAAQRRNRAHPHVLLAVFVVLALLLAMVAVANAQAAPELDDGFDEELTVVAGASAPEPEPDAEVYARIARAAPPASEVVAAAYRAAGLDKDPIPSLARRARMSSLIPWISVRGGEDATWRDVADPTVGHLTVFDVSATWHLDRLAFDATELRTASLEATRRRERRRLALRVVRTYYRWLAGLAVAERTGRASARADEAAAELDALTDGWLSQRFPDKRENLPAR